MKYGNQISAGRINAPKAKRLYQKQKEVESGPIKVQTGDLLTLFFETDGKSLGLS